MGVQGFSVIFCRWKRTNKTCSCYHSRSSIIFHLIGVWIAVEAGPDLPLPSHFREESKEFPGQPRGSAWRSFLGWTCLKHLCKELCRRHLNQMLQQMLSFMWRSSVSAQSRYQMSELLSPLLMQGSHCTNSAVLMRATLPSVKCVDH